MALPWFRMYHEFAGDPIVQSLSHADQRHYVMVLCFKCDGVLDRPMRPSVRDRIIAKSLGIDEAEAAQVRERLAEVLLVDARNWQPTNWEKRQYNSDVSTERTRKYRKNNHLVNVPETSHIRSGNGPDTDTDTDTEITPSQAVEEGVQGGGAPKSRDRSPAARATRCPNAAAPPDGFSDVALGLGVASDRIQWVWDEFRDYWIGVPGQRGCKLDWLATWRNQCRKEVTKGETHQRGYRLSAAERVRAANPTEPDPEIDRYL